MDEQNKYRSKKTGDYYERLVNRLSDYYLKKSPKGEEDQWFLVPIDEFTHSTKKSLNITDLKRFYVPLIEQTDLPDLISKINDLQLRNIE